jgi:hypothetical protein
LAFCVAEVDRRFGGSADKVIDVRATFCVDRHVGGLKNGIQVSDAYGRFGDGDVRRCAQLTTTTEFTVRATKSPFAKRRTPTRQ